ncbi:tubulin binding cofactor C-domain-containing protein [Catenaria anguillulae PL171]|uniref:Tubulin binding cofactor C-domain-containing protein n=1 Tax=Catenaria anguillulae PL171 TaxID=765915 RepID=A0A1Y2HCI4_9FUNG|nr:tubulin binding cofactor C-domain-containing protein [Catenaria anguillulae PL171]
MGNCLTCIRSLFSWARSDSQSALVANDVKAKETQQLLCQPAAPLTTESSEPNESHTPDVLLSVVTQIDGKPYSFSKLGALDQPTVVAAKPTGSALKGSAFAIEECGCLIFIGPCDGSVFIRDCSDCTIFVIGRQVRFRDCSKCYIYIHSATPPALETSRDMSFRVFQGSYERLQEHFNSANLEVYTNQWARVHDFSPPSDTTLPPNFALQPSESSWAPAQVHLPPTIHKDLVDKLGSVPILSGLNLSTVSVPMTRPAQQVSECVVDCRTLKDSAAIKAFGPERVGSGLKLVAFLCSSQQLSASAQEVVWQMVDASHSASTALHKIFGT